MLAKPDGNDVWERRREGRQGIWTEEEEARREVAREWTGAVLLVIMSTYAIETSTASSDSKLHETHHLLSSPVSSHNPVMSKGPTRHLLVALPNSITPSRDQSDALSSLKTTLQPTNHADSTYAFTIPTFKIGTLDALVQQADELSKLSSDAEVVVGKVGDSLTALLEGDAEKIQQQKVVGDSMSF
jgi:hypothetical protein